MPQLHQVRARAAVRVLLVVFSGLLSGCPVLRPAVFHSRRAERPPRAVVSHFHYRKGQKLLSEEALGDGSTRFRFEVYDSWSQQRREVVWELYRVPAAGRHPAVIVTPIFEGSLRVERYIAASLVDAGISAVILNNPATILDPDLDAWGIESAFRGSICDLRRVVDWLVERDDVDPLRLGTAGVSLGAIRNVVLAAVEPRLRAHAFLLGGADVAGILMASPEAPVRRYREKRMRRESLNAEALLARLRRAFFYDDAALLRSVDPEGVILVVARFDDTVPGRFTDRLRRRLGEPETIVIPSGHYTALPFVPFAVQRVVAFFERRF